MSTTKQGARTSRAPRKDVVRNRELLLDAAREVFARRGLAATLDDIAHEAGLGVATAYRHFANKPELATAIMRQSFQQLNVEVHRLLELEDPWQGIVEFFEYVMVVQSGNRGLHEALNGIPAWDQMDPERDELWELVARLFSRAQDAGSIRADVVPSDMVFLLMMSSGLSDIAGDAHPELWRRYLPMLLEGLKPGGTPLTTPGLTREQLLDTIKEHKRC